jgi:hypothetical protein
MPQDSFPQGHLGYLFVFRMMKETMGCCLLECYRNIHPAHISHVREELQEKKNPKGEWTPEKQENNHKRGR